MLLLSKSKAFPNGLANNRGQVGRHYFTHNTASTLTALFPVQSQQLVRHARAGHRGRQLGGRQLRPLGARFHRRRQSLGVFRPAADRRGEHEHVRQGAGLGLGVEVVRQGERGPLEPRLHPEDDAAVRGQLSRSRSDGEGCARLPGVPDHRRLQGERPEDRRLHAGQDDAVVHGGRRDRGAAGTGRHDGTFDARVRRHAHGRRTARRTSSTAGASPTRCRTSACSARR